MRTAGPGYSSPEWWPPPSTGCRAATSSPQLRQRQCACAATRQQLRQGSRTQLLAAAHARHAPDLFHLAFRHAGGHRNALAGQLSLAAGSHRHPGCSYAENAAEPYLNLHLRQPIHLRRDGTGGFEALLELRNLLAQGYQPYLLSDGSLLCLRRTSAASAAVWPSPSERQRTRASAAFWKQLLVCAIFSSGSKIFLLLRLRATIVSAQLPAFLDA